MKKKIIMMTIGAALAAGVAQATDAGATTNLASEIGKAINVSATADFASAYVFRGTTINNGLVFQPGATISGFAIPEEFGSVSLGTWANYDIDRNATTLEKYQFSEIDYIATYKLPVKVVDLSATYTEYTYPNTPYTTDREVAFAIGKAIGESGLYPSITFNYGVDGAIKNDWYIQGGFDYTKKLTDALTFVSGVKVGYMIDAGTVKGPDGLNDTTAKIGLSYALTKNWSLSGSLNGVAQMNDKVLTDTEYDKPVFGMLGVACNF